MQYILALGNFDIAAHQPHPPGNPLFVFSGWIVSSIIGDRFLGLYLVSILSFGGGAVCIYYLGRSLFDEITGLAAALFYIFSPLSGFFTAYPNTYIIEAGISALVLYVMSLWICPRGSEIDQKKPSSLLLPWIVGLLSGFRITFMVFSLPALLLLFFKKQKGRVWILIINLVLACLVWVVPLLLLTGGPMRYMQAFEAESGPFIRQFSVFNMMNNLDMLRKTIFGALGYLGFVPIIYGILSSIRIGFQKDRFDSRTRFLVVLAYFWIIPPLFFYIKNLMHPGYFFIFFPLYMIGMARSILWISRSVTVKKPEWSGLLSFIMIVGVLISLIFHWSGQNKEFFSRVTVKNSEDRVIAFITAMEDNFPVENTVIVSMEHFRQVQWYLPESYAVFPQAVYVNDFGTDIDRANIYTAHQLNVEPREWHFRRNEPISPVMLPENIEYVVVCPMDWRYLGNQDGFSVSETEVGEQYMWKKVEGRIAITLDGDFWVVATLHEVEE